MSKLALIAGQGILPRIWAKAAVNSGNKLYIFQVSEEETLDLADFAEKLYKISIAELDRLITLLKENEVQKVVFIGKVEKKRLFEIRADQRLQLILSVLNNFNDDTILRAIAAEFEKEGIKVLSQSNQLGNLLVEAGQLTEFELTDQLISELEFAFVKAVEIGRLDIGQTVMAKNKAVIAVEAIEGTDKTILRAGELAGSGTVMAKVCKPEQDFRFDIPTVGLDTIDNLIKIGASGLILEAGKTFILNKEKFISRAQEAAIVVAAVQYSSGGILWGK